MTKQAIDRQFLQSLSRGLTVLEGFTPERPRLTLTEMANVTGLNLAFLQRCTHTLVSLGYLRKNQRKQYSLGPRVLSLGYSCLQGSELRRMAESQLRAFSQRIGFTVNLGVLDGSDVLVLYRHELQRFFNFDVQPGTKLPCYCTAMGKLLLAALDNDSLNQVLAGVKLERLTSSTITRRSELVKQLANVREQGFAESDREATPALYSIAAPLINYSDQVVAAINVSIMKGHDTEDVPRDLHEDLIEEGRKLSALLGYQDIYPRIVAGPPSKGGI
jgi:IclR family pca regulon transcriptional regulator